jgi:fructokinase
MKKKPLLGAIEAGGTKFVCAVAQAAGEILAETRIATTQPGTTLGAALDFFAAQAARFGDYAAFGIAAFGPLDLRQGSPAYGRLLETPKPGWSHTDLLAPFTRRFGCPAAIDTDVNAAALGEALHGAGRGCGTVAYVTVGTGIGGGVVIDGRTLKGALHPEMGHIRVPRHPHDLDFAGTCPFHGDCLEGLASGTAIRSRYGAPLDGLPPQHEAFQVAGHYLGQLAVNVLLLLSPERLIFGGGVMRNPALLTEIHNVSAGLLRGYAGMGRSADALQGLIVTPGLGERSGITGALALALSLRGGKRP